MKRYSQMLMLIVVLLFLAACQPELVIEEATVEVTREVEVRVDVEVTREVPVEVEVEVTREVSVEVPVEVTRVVEVAVEPSYAPETEIMSIPLAGPVADRDSEISGMTWYGDYLILLPQYPNFFLEEGEGDGFVFAIAREDLAAVINGESYDPLEPIQIPFSAPGAQEDIDGFEGFEAIAFVGDTAYITIESETEEGVITGYLISGAMAPDLSGLVMDTSAYQAIIQPQAALPNFSEEALVIAGDTIFTLYEANGAGVNPEPVVHLFNGDLEATGTLPMANLEYRLTDATELDENGRFWVTNYFFPGEEIILPAIAPLFEAFGVGPTHQWSSGVERLVELQYSEDGITLTDTPPMQLQLMADGNLRNWEGIARYETMGLLIATDKFPRTILAFVPFPEAEE